MWRILGVRNYNLNLTAIQSQFLTNSSLTCARHLYECSQEREASQFLTSMSGLEKASGSHPASGSSALESSILGMSILLPMLDLILLFNHGFFIESPKPL